ncbi:unnamed protein product [Brachionus calyciflorus]|uniref:Uncharacterized protein n=1 Tax=Brachionus calyciflorus TaxID=104777 RepID=A0A813Z086_9BILA|nr:unnamed protein product [Brachionus calyciflorus]
MDSPNKPRYLKNSRKNKIKEEILINLSNQSDIDEPGKDIKDQKKIKDSEKKKTLSNSKKKIEINDATKNDSSSNNVDLENLRLHMPKWAGTIRYFDIDNITLTNTCTIDNLLLALWYLSKKKQNVLKTKSSMKLI